MRIADAACEPPKYDRDIGLEPRAGDRMGGRVVLDSWFSDRAKARFIRYETPCRCRVTVSLASWRIWAKRFNEQERRAA